MQRRLLQTTLCIRREPKVEEAEEVGLVSRQTWSSWCKYCIIRGEK